MKGAEKSRGSFIRERLDEKIIYAVAFLLKHVIFFNDVVNFSVVFPQTQICSHDSWPAGKIIFAKIK